MVMMLNGVTGSWASSWTVLMSILLGSCSTDMMSHLERLMARTYLGAQMEIIGIWLDDEPDLTAEKKANWQRLHDTLSQVRCHQTLLVLFQGVGRRFQIIRIVV